MRTGIILLYHRVIDLEHDREQLAVAPARFDAHLHALRRDFALVPLREIVRRIASGEDTGGCAAITFDDGYADNLHVAGPILERHGAPATFFLTAAMIGSAREFWWGEIERIIFAADNARRLEIEIAGTRHRWDIGAVPAADVYHEIHRLVRHRPHAERAAFLDHLLAWSAPPERQPRKTHRVLNREEAAALARIALFEIGSHGMTHTSLASEPGDCLRYEIVESKRLLERLLSREVRSFSYPFGLRKNVNEEVMRLVRAAGYTCGIANTRDPISTDTDLFMVPRFLVRDWEPDEFRRRVEAHAEARTP